MALVTIQRSPSPSNSTESVSEDSQDGLAEESDLSGSNSSSRSKRSKAGLKRLRKLLTTIRFVNKLRFSENYFAVKGAALILPRSECTNRRRPSHTSITTGIGGGDIHRHLQLMIYLLRPQDTIKVAVKLESMYPSRHRYLTVVSTTGRQDSEESVILGLDVQEDEATIGLIIPIWGTTKIKLDGDGGFLLTTISRDYIFKPVSVQAMWSCLQSLNKLREVAGENNYYPKGLTHTWVSYYQAHISSDQSCINEWNTMEDVESTLYNPEVDGPEQVEENIKHKLKEIMMQVDLDDVTCKYLRKRLEEELNMKLDHMKQLIEKEMFFILRQMDASSKIFDYLYLGSEWNACNLEELQKNGIKYILNISREIDNFYPDLFEYCNIRLYDETTSELLKHWDKTYKFIKKAKHHHSKVLVHCRMGISRSASTVMAFAMKEYGWNLQETLKYVKERRNVVNPNAGFMKQLVTYQGILDASKQRHNSLWRSRSENDLTNQQLTLMQQDTRDPSVDTMNFFNLDLTGQTSSDDGPRSWSPADGAAEIFMKASHFDLDSSDEDHSQAGSEYTNIPMIPSQQGMAQSLPIMPFPMEHLDEYCDMSSRSADSLDIDEAFQDGIPEEEGAFALPVTFDKGPVVLLNYTKIEDLGVCRPRGSSAVYSDVSEESDFEDDDQTGQIKGFYDVAMLSGFELEGIGFKPVQEEDDDGGLNVDLSEELETLHPDMKIELALSDYKKKLRIAKLLLFQQKDFNSQTETQPDVIRPEVKESKRHQKEQASVAKLRPDDFWIKDIPPSPASQELPEKDEAVDKEDLILNLESICATESNTNEEEPAENTDSDATKEVTVDKIGSTDEVKVTKCPEEKPQLQSFISQIEMNIPGTASEPVSNTESTDQSAACSVSETDDVEKDTEHCGKEEEGASDSGARFKEMGVWQHYEKESIPWSAGTVKRTTQEMEEKQKDLSIKSVVNRVQRLSGGSSGTGGSPVGSQEKLSTIEPLLLSQQDTGLSEAEVKMSLDQHNEGTSLSPKSSPRSVKSQSSGSSLGDVSGEKGKAEEHLKQRVSVYEMEDIPFEPASVQRIKLEIEQREKSSSFSDPEESNGKTVQRSSSCRSESKSPTNSKFDRNSARRRTVLPIVRSSPGRDVRSKSTGHLQRKVKDKQSSKSDPEEEQDLEVKVIKIKEESVALKEGQVKKHKKEFEERDNGVQKDAVQKTAIAGETGLIRSGSVKKHRDEIETKYRVSDPSDHCEAGLMNKSDCIEITGKEDVLPDNKDTNAKLSATLGRSCDRKEDEGTETSPKLDRSSKSKEDISKMSPTLKRSSESNEGRSKLSPTFSKLSQKEASEGKFSPTLEKVLRRSPSLRRKLETDEVIACHSPQEKMGQVVSSGQGSVVTDQTGSGQCKDKLSKSVSAPPTKQGEREKTGLSDSPKTRCESLQSSLAVEEGGVERYEEEGISWCVGTVRQQLQAMENRNSRDTPTPPAAEEHVGDTAKTEVKSAACDVTAENTKLSAGSMGNAKTSGGSVGNTKTNGEDTKVSEEGRVQAEVGIVQKIKSELEDGQKAVELRQWRLQDVEKASHERTHSLGSKMEIQAKGEQQDSTSKTAGIERSSSLKENSPTKPSSPLLRMKSSSEADTKSRKSRRMASNSAGRSDAIVMETVIATHVPSSSPVRVSAGEERHVVIIPKSEVSVAADSSRTKSPQVPGSASAQAPTSTIQQQTKQSSEHQPMKPTCDTISTEESSSAPSSPRESANRNVPSSLCYQRDDIRVKDLLDKFETGSLGKKSPPVSSEGEDVKSQQEGNGATTTEGSAGKVDSGKKLDKSTGFGIAYGISTWEEGREKRKEKKLHGKSHPLSKLAKQSP